ncbi:hypothetical protein BGX26_008404, partial [Mortierella sp. AD094]
NKMTLNQYKKALFERLRTRAETSKIQSKTTNFIPRHRAKLRCRCMMMTRDMCSMMASTRSYMDITGLKSGGRCMYHRLSGQIEFLKTRASLTAFERQSSQVQGFLTRAPQAPAGRCFFFLQTAHFAYLGALEELGDRASDAIDELSISLRDIVPLRSDPTKLASEASISSRGVTD